MVENTAIAWADHTQNFWIGCTPVGPGCDSCYAWARDIRFDDGVHWGVGAPRRRTSVENWRKPFAWDRKAAASGVRPRVMCGSLCDIFDREVPAQTRAEALGVVDACRNLRWMLISKRIGNAEDDMQAAFLDNRDHVGVIATMVNQQEIDRDTPKLLAVRAAWWGISVEPQLGPITLPPALCRHAAAHPGRTWVIGGGESYQRAFHATRADVRGYNLKWAFSLKAQCALHGVAYFQKQLGARPYMPNDRPPFEGQPLAYLCERDGDAGADINDWPGPLRIQEFPEPLK
jgi:protein gp37